MVSLAAVAKTFPFVSIASESGGLPVEVSLIAKLGQGAGNQVCADVAARQQQHSSFIDEMDEPSAKLGGSHFSKGDPTALYSFVVGPQGHPFHRHAGHRIFTAVSGGSGAQLRFSSASDQQIQDDSQNFVRAMHFVNIPADCIFTVRFGGQTWHQFAPLAHNAAHPVLFALSCHTNEMGGNLSEAQKQKVLANEASIPALTEFLPAAVKALLSAQDSQFSTVRTTVLAFDAQSEAPRLPAFFPAQSRAGVHELIRPPEDSLLLQQLPNLRIHHDDTFCLPMAGVDFTGAGAKQLLAAVLEGFLRNPPPRVSGLMAVRNVLVKPLGLRTSPLGCPVSSLLSPDTSNLFSGRYPVLAQSVNATDTKAQVVLGADDKHLLFRSCVGVEIIDRNHIEVTLGTRVHCKNWFGRFYMSAIDYVHRHHVTPSMLQLAADYAVPKKGEVQVVEPAGQWVNAQPSQ